MKNIATLVEKLLVDAGSAGITVGPESWFDFWHTHVDWNGIGNGSPELRVAAIDALFIKHRAVLEALRSFGKIYQSWIMVHPDSADDSVCLHSPNPQSTFPYPFSGVDWDVQVPEILDKHSDCSDFRVGVSQSEEGPVYWLLHVG